jgi:hypothetical protein
MISLSLPLILATEDFEMLSGYATFLFDIFFQSSDVTSCITEKN